VHCFLIWNGNSRKYLQRSQWIRVAWRCYFKRWVSVYAQCREKQWDLRDIEPCDRKTLPRFISRMLTRNVAGGPSLSIPTCALRKDYLFLMLKGKRWHKKSQKCLLSNNFYFCDIKSRLNNHSMIFNVSHTFIKYSRYYILWSVKCSIYL
jgi:hypothetical protein